MANLLDLLEVGRDEKDGAPTLMREVEVAVDFGFRSHVDADRRLLQYQQLGLCLHPSRDHDLLLVATAEAPDHAPRIGWAYRVPGQDLGPGRKFPVPTD